VEADIAFAVLSGHLSSMEWGLVARDFENCDGALCDIYVQNATLDDWQAVLDQLRQSELRLELQLDGEIIELPEYVSKLLRRLPDDPCPTMYVQISDITLNCHFFTDEEIEFDLDPREMRPELLPAIVDFLKLLGRTTHKPVSLTVENSPEAAIMRFDPADANVQYVGPASE
jgi:hypothetical protein